MEKKLIKKYFENNTLNIEKIVNEYTGYLYKTIENISNFVLSKEDIEEIIYDTFFAMWSNKEKLILDNSITAYLVAIAKNLTTHKYRKIKFEFNIEECESESSLISYDDIINVLETKEKDKKLYEEINNLNTLDKNIFELFYYYNKKTKEIATLTNKPDFYIRSRLHRIRKKLNKRLEE